MGSLLINVPDIADSDLIYNEYETRQILKFFWPDDATTINGMPINNDARRLAQTALIAAIDGSYALGFIDALAQSILRQNRSIMQLAGRLAYSYARHWWRHARQADLQNIRIYDSVRRVVARELKRQLKMLQNGISASRYAYPFYAHIQSVNNIVWS